MKPLFKVFVVCMFAIVRFEFGETSTNPVRCYVCNSFDEPSCESGKLTDNLLRNCSSLKHGSKYKFCRTITQVIDFKMLKMESGNRVIRQCAEEWDQKRACYNKGGLGGRATVCHCDGEGCNAASLPTSVILTVFISLAFSLKVILL